MMVGTLAVLYYGLQSGTEQRALTLAFTTFVLFQVFNVFNARSEKGTSFNAHFFDNAMLWASLAGIIVLQAIAVHWPPAQPIFGTGGMTLADWGIATGVAASVLHPRGRAQVHPCGAWALLLAVKGNCLVSPWRSLG